MQIFPSYLLLSRMHKPSSLLSVQDFYAWYPNPTEYGCINFLVFLATKLRFDKNKVGFDWILLLCFGGLSNEDRTVHDMP